MKVHFFTKYGKQGASSRYRTYQYLPGLEKEKISCSISALLSDEYLMERYKTGKPPFAIVLKSLLDRFYSKPIDQYDLVVVEKELFPYMPFFFEYRLLKKTRAFALDFDDALFHLYDKHKYGVVRSLLRSKYPRLISNAALITAGNTYIATYARQFGTRIEILPTVVDVARYPVTSEPDGIFTVGWVGTPHTQKYLHSLAVPLRNFFRRRKGRLLAIGANSSLKLEDVPLEIAPWSEENEVRLLQCIHVGIMPLPDLPIERGKSGLKLLQYMACGRPVIASPVGVNVDIVGPDVGYLANSDDAWLSNLIKLADNADMRMKMGKRGRKLVENNYSLSIWAPRYAQMLREAAGFFKYSR